MGVLVDDVDANVVVTSVTAIKGQASTSVTNSNFRNDVNANSVISNTDVSLTKANVGSSLP